MEIKYSKENTKYKVNVMVSYGKILSNDEMIKELIQSKDVLL